jgi:EAL domain-containing protein (putative c-di-GMP-specific phosphodiesterase class I)
VFNYLDSSFHVLRRTSQVIYVGTQIVCAFLISLYVYAKNSSGRVVSKRIIGYIAIPGIISIISLFVGQVSYTTNASGEYYNVGSVVMFNYLIGFFYIFVTMIIAIFLHKRLRKEDAFCIIAGLVIWAILAFFQFSYHGFQVSSIAMMLMALILFLSSENPKEYYEKDLFNVKNKDAFIMLLIEKFGRKRPFFIASVIFTGKATVLTGEDRQMLNDLQNRLSGHVEETEGETAFRFEWNTLSYVVESPEAVERLMGIINNYKDDRGNYKLTFSVLEVPKYTQKVDEAIQILSYVSGEYVYTQYAPNLVVNDEIVDKMKFRNSIEDVVRQAVRDKAFEVYYQPILNVKEGRFASAEALVRLRRSDRENFISPEDFIPIAEKCGLVQEIDDLVFEKVCSFIARENIQSYGVKTIEVNLSGNEVVDRHTYTRLASKMEKYHIPPKFINFEITETAYINNDEAFKENVQKLKEMGSTFSMDDFGSGYSNLLELLKMDYVLVKMDKEFIWKCLDTDKPENMRMLEYSINFLKDYGLHVLAEGIETIEQAEILIEKGVEYLQGFYYSRPVPESEYIEFLKAQKGDKQ